MTIYRNMRNDKLAELLNCSENGATMKLLDTNETIEVGLPTLKRWWKTVSPFAQETVFAECEIAPENNNAPGPSYEAQAIPPMAPEPETTSPADTDPSTADDSETQALPIEPTLAPVEPEPNNEGDNKGQSEKPSTGPL